MKNNYYTDQLNKIKPVTQYPPTVKFFANGNGDDTNNLSLNEESAISIINWLAENFLNNKTLTQVLSELNKLPI